MRYNRLGTEVDTCPVNIPGISPSALMVDLPLPVPERQPLPLKTRDGGNDRHTVALLPSCLEVWGATDEVMTALQAALPKGVVVVTVKYSLPFDRPCHCYKQPSLHSSPFPS